MAVTWGLAVGVHRAALHALGSNQTGLTRVLVNLGPFGSSHAGSPGLYIWAVFYVALTALLATVVFAGETSSSYFLRPRWPGSNAVATLWRCTGDLTRVLRSWR
jgi:hypothetical protein